VKKACFTDIQKEPKTPHLRATYHLELLEKNAKYQNISPFLVCYFVKRGKELPKR